MPAAATLCLTFDNMGRAREIAAGTASKPDALEPGLAIGYPRLLDLLDELDVRGTFFIEGWNGLHHPERVQELAARGHEVGLHGWVHEKFGALDKPRAEQLLRPRTPAELEASWLAAIDRTAEARATTTVVIHAFVSGVDDERFAVVRKVLTHARTRGDIEITTAGALAERVLAQQH